MWIFTSVVRQRDQSGSLLVRARLNGDIERVFPTAQVAVDTGSDYRFQATLPESKVVDEISRRLLDIDYDNFKSSVHEPKRHGVYFKL